jgi:DNA replication protein DnaC
MTTAEDDRLEFKLPDVEFDDDVEVCPKCFGAGVVVEEEDGVRRGRVCDCQRGRATKRRAAAAGIPARYRECSLDNFDIVSGFTHESVIRAKRLAQSFVDNYPAVDAGLLFMGSVGVGKTHLAAGIVKALTEQKGADCRWCDFSDLLAEVKKRYAGSAFDEYVILEPLVGAEVLLLDDLGSMKIRDWTLDFLSYVINQRYVNRRIVIATTNYLDEPIKEETLGEFARREETLAERIGPRLRSRLLEMCKTVPLGGSDFRREQRQTGILRNL